MKDVELDISYGYTIVWFSMKALEFLAGFFQAFFRF
jgi:hypothetical protein